MSVKERTRIENLVGARISEEQSRCFRDALLLAARRHLGAVQRKLVRVQRACLIAAVPSIAAQT
jgi:hypothetical protein